MKLILGLLLSVYTSMTFAQSAEGLLAAFMKDYRPSLEVRHDLFLQEYNAQRLKDYASLYQINSIRFNSLISEYTKLTDKWNTVLISANQDRYILPTLANMKAQMENLENEAQSAALTLGVLHKSYPLACSEQTISWMEDTFRPLKIYQIPVFTFDGVGDGSGNMNASYQINFGLTFNEQPSGDYGTSANAGGGVGEAGMYSTAGGAIGTYVGGAFGSTVPFLGTTVGAFAGGAIGTAIGAGIGYAVTTWGSSSDYNDMIKKAKKAYVEINTILSSSHEKVDLTHQSKVYGYCKEIFRPELGVYFANSAENSLKAFNSIQSENARIDFEWREIQKFHNEKYDSNLTFLEMIISSQDIDLESSQEENFEILKEINKDLSRFKNTTYAPTLAQIEVNDLNSKEKLIDMAIFGDSLFNNHNYPLMRWEVMAQEISKRLENLK